MLRDLRIPFFTAVFLFVGFFLYFKIAGPIPFSINSIQTNNNNLFTVTGTGKATATPTEASISINVTKTGTSEQDVKDQMNIIVNKVTQDLISLGILEKDIQTSNFSITPQYNDRGITPLDGPGANKPTQIIGYTGNTSIQVKAKTVDLANKALDTATGDGANQVYGPNFVLDDAAREAAQQKARIQAIQNAKKQAEQTAQAAGVSLGKIISIYENSNQIPYAQGATTMKAENTTADTSTNLNPGENTITVSVSLSYEIQ